MYNIYKMVNENYHRDYYEKNKEKIKAQVLAKQTETKTCEVCGCNVQKQWYRNHLQTRKCQNISKQIKLVMNRKKELDAN
jgi:hypothetical protein